MMYVSPQTRLYNACLTKILYNMATKLISVRIEEDVLEKIDYYCEGRGYRTRSWCINRILERVLCGNYKVTLWKIESNKDEIQI